MSKTLVIAEPGSTHEGDLVKMLQLVDLAAEVGADVFKNQWLSKAERLCERRNAPEYLWSYQKLAYPVHWHRIVAEWCAARGLEYACSVYVPEDVAVIAPYVKYLKIASFEASDPEMSEAVRWYRDRLIVSTGLMTEEETVRFRWRAFAVLHCISSYITPDDQANLAAIRRLRAVLADSDVKIGWSDHTTSSLTGALAVAAGAEVVEFHLRDGDCSPNNADYEVARDEYHARAYIANIRLTERMLGDGAKRPMPCEEAMMRYRVGAPQ